MLDVRVASAATAQSWSVSWHDRLREWYGWHNSSAAWVQRMVDQRQAERDRAAQTQVFDLVCADEVIGMLALAVESKPPSVSISDVYVTAQHRRQGRATAAIAWARDWARTHATTVAVVTDAADPAHRALFAGFPVRAYTMLKHLSTPDTVAAGLAVRPMLDEEFPDWRAARVREYANQIAESGLLSPDDAAIRAAAQFDQILPNGIHSANQAFWSVTARSDLVGAVWLGLHYAPDTSWVFSVDIDEQYRGKGYGRGAMLAAEQVALQAGDNQICLNVFVTNTVAIGLYDSLGYRTVHQHRSIDLQRQ